MRKKVTILFSCIMLGICELRGQSLIAITGVVQDSAGNALPKATVRLYDQTDSIVLLSDDKGRFFVSRIWKRSECAIVITMEGFQPYTKTVDLSGISRQLKLPPCVLRQEYRQLEEVIVHKEKPLTIRSDTIDYHAGAYSLRQNSMLSDLVKRLPGLWLDPDSNLIAFGEKIKKVQVDGNDFYNGDVKIALRNIPFDMIDKVELIDDPGNQSRLTGIKGDSRVKILNIILKPEKRHGLFGEVQLGVANNDQYTGNLTVTTLKGDRLLAGGVDATHDNPIGSEYNKALQFNFADRWKTGWSITDNANLQKTDYQFQTSVLQNSYYKGGVSTEQQNTVTSGNRSIQELDWELARVRRPNSEFRFTTFLNNSASTETTRTNETSTESDSALSKSTLTNTANVLNIHNTVIDSRLYFDKVFPITGQRFDATANFRYLLANQAGDNRTSITLPHDTAASETTVHYNLSNKHSSWDMGGDLHYYFPIAGKDFLELGYTLHQRIEQSNRNWQEPDIAGQWQTVDSLSNNYTFRTLLQIYRAGYDFHSPKLDFQLGLNAEPNSLNGETPDAKSIKTSHYLNLYPTGSVNFLLNKTQTIVLGYSTTVVAPTLQQIQPVTDISDPQYPVTGNPELKPATVKVLSLRYNLNLLKATDYHGFGVGLTYLSTSNMVVTNLVHPTDTGAIIQQTYFENVNGNHALELAWHVDPPKFLNKNLKVSLWGSLNLGHNVALSNALPYKTSTFTANENLDLQYTSTHNEADVFVLYTTSVTQFRNNTSPPVSASSVVWGLKDRHFFLERWTFAYDLQQTLTGSNGSRLITGPTTINTHLERSLGKKNKFSCVVSVLNILNASAGMVQTVALNPTKVTQTRADFVGRTFMLSVRWKFDHYVKTKSP